MKPQWRIGKRLGWALANTRNAVAVNALCGGVIGAAVGYYNGTLGGGAHPLITYWIPFTLGVNAVWIVLLTLIALPWLFLLAGAVPASRQETSRKEVFLVLILPCAVLQILVPLIATALYFAVPVTRQFLGFLVPDGNPGSLLGRAQMITLALGSCLGAVVLTLIWRGAAADAGASRLLPLD